MDVILKKDVDGLGYLNDIVKVKAGYGRNFLIPRGIAVLATISEKKVMAENIKQREHKESKLREAAEVMSCTESSVKVLLFRARNKLKQHLAEFH